MINKILKYKIKLIAFVLSSFFKYYNIKQNYKKLIN